jgi:hypothetical protein
VIGKESVDDGAVEHGKIGGALPLLCRDGNHRRLHNGGERTARINLPCGRKQARDRKSAERLDGSNGAQGEGCGSGSFDPNVILEYRPVRMDGEQVMLNAGQLDCGVREDLWNVASLGVDRSVGRLTQKGRDLQFSDDVQIGEPGNAVPYAQVRGSFLVKVIQPSSVRDEDAFTKTSDPKVGVMIDHLCFQNNPPFLMGVRHGRFDQSANPVFRFKLDREWLVDRVVH